MANTKKFIVKNGLLTPNSAIIGTYDDNGVDSLQVSGSTTLSGKTVITSSDPAIPTIDIRNSGGFALNSIIASFRGDSDGLNVTNEASGVYALFNSAVDNGVLFYDNNSGVEIEYGGTTRFQVNSAGNNLIGFSTVDGNRILTVADEGSGNGLDADTLDGLDSSQFLRNDISGTLDGNLTVTGNFTVSGTTTTINTETLLLADNIITLNSNYTGSTPTENGGIEVERGTQNNSAIVWDELSDFWKLVSVGTDLGRIITTADEGSGNGFDADTVDGLEASQFLRSDVNDTAEGNITIRGSLVVGNDTTASNIFMNGAGVNRSIYSNNGEIGFLGASANFTAYSDATGNWVVTNNVNSSNVNATANVTAGASVNATLDVTAGRDIAAVGEISGNTASANIYYDAGNANYYGDFASTSVVNTIDLEGTIRHNGDTNTYIQFHDEDQFRVVTGNSERFEVNSSFVLVSNQMRAPIFYDSADTSFYADFAGTSRLVDIDLTGVIRNDTDTNTYIEFNAPDEFSVITGGSTRLNVNNTFTSVTNEFRSPIFRDTDNTSFYVNPSSDSVLNSLNVINGFAAGTVSSTLDLTVGRDLFVNNDAVVAGDLSANTITSTSDVEVGGDLNVVGRVTSADVRSGTYYDTNLVNYADFGNTTASIYAAGAASFGAGASDLNRANDTSGTGGISLVTHGSLLPGQNTMLQISGNSGGYALGYFNKIGIGTNPLNDSNRYLSFFNNGTQAATFRGDSFGNVYWINDAGGSYNIYDNSGNPILVADSSGSVVIGDSSAQYATSDATPTVGSISPNRLHVAGSIQLNDANDAIVFGRGASTFLKDEELKFGWGSGWYMTDSSFLRLINNTTLFTSGEIRAGSFRDTNDSSRFIDLNSGGLLSGSFQIASSSSTSTSYTTAGIQLREGNFSGSGVVPPRIAFHWAGDVASQISIDTSGRIQIRDNAGTGFENFEARLIYGQAYYDSNNTAFFVDPASSARLRTLDIYSGEASATLNVGRNANERFNIEATDVGGYIRYIQDEVGAENHSVFFEISSGSSGANIFSFNRPVSVTGDITTSTSFRAPRFFDSDNDTFYGDFASTSRMNTIDISGTIRHDGDTNTYIEFNAADQLRVVTGGAERLVVNNSYVLANNQMRSPLYYDSDNTAFYGDFASASRMNEIDLVGGIYRDGDAGRNTYIDFPLENTIRFVTGAAQSFGIELNYAIANQEMRAPIFTDSNNTAFYLDPASTSILSTARANTFEVAAGLSMSAVTGNYGTVKVSGQTAGWAGYAIEDDWVFMSNGATTAGIYNDTDNEWSIQLTRNGSTDLFFNGIEEFSTQSGYALATNQMRAPIFFDSNNTGFYIDPAAGNTFTSFSTNGIINRSGFANGSGSGNIFLRAEDTNSWIWNTATNWGIFWATDTTAAHRHIPFGDNTITFVGSGITRAAIDLDSGDMNVSNQFSARYVTIDTGNDSTAENISLNPAYGSGGADLMLFDGTHYFENRAVRALEPIESNMTTSLSEYVRTTDGPFAGSYVLQTNAYRTFISAFIPVVPGEELYGEISAKNISGSGGLIYYGIERYDSEKRPITSNQGTAYFVVSAVNQTSTSWVTYRGTTVIPTTHTPYLGSDGGGTYYVKIRILMNHSTGGALRQYGGIQLKRRNVESNLLVDNLEASTISATSASIGTVDAAIFRDRDNTAFFLNPASSSTLSTLVVNGNTTVGGSVLTTNVTTSNGQQLVLSAGESAGQATGQTNEYVYVNAESGLEVNTSGDNWSSGWAGRRTTTIGHDGISLVGRVTAGDMSAATYFDSNNTAFYLDPTSTSNITRMVLTQTGNSDILAFGGTGIKSVAGDGGVVWTNLRELRLSDRNSYDYNDWGGIKYNSSSRLMYIGGPASPFFTSNTNPQLSSVIFTGTDLVSSDSSFRAPIFYDSDNTAYYVDPANTNTSIFVGGVIENPAVWMANGVTQGNWNENLRLRRASNGISTIAFNASGALGQPPVSVLGYDDRLEVRVGSGWIQRTYLDRVEFIGDIRPTIMTDRDNTGTFVNPSATSLMNTITANRFNLTNMGDYITFYGDDSTQHSITSRNEAGSISDDLRINTYGSLFVNLDSNANNSSAADFRIGRHGTGEGPIDALGLFDVWGDALFVSSNQSFRAPVFFDLDNTGFFVNPAGSSVMQELDIRGEVFNDGWFRNDTSGRGLYSTPNAMHFFSDNTQRFTLQSSQSTVSMRLATAGVAQRGFVYADDANNIGFLNQSGSWRMRIVNGDYALFDGSSVRAPIFYDTADTNYYLDPASQTNLSTLAFNGAQSWGTISTATLGHNNLAYYATAFGRKIYTDEEFVSGNGAVNLYNNAGGTALVITKQADSTAPNSSNFILNFSRTDTSNGTSPGFGGFHMATITSANQILVARFRARVPVGKSFIFASNAFGTGSTSRWLTDNVGTGKWEEYAYLVQCGATGSFSSTMFFYISGGSSTGTQFDLASASVYDLTNQNEHNSREYFASVSSRAPIFYDSDNTSFYTDPASTSVVGDIQAGIYYARSNTAYSWIPNTSAAHRLQTPNGWLDIGPMNAGYSHFQTDRPSFYFNKRVEFDGDIRSYTGNSSTYFAAYYDSNDTTYFSNHASTSRYNYLKVRNLFDDESRRFTSPQGGTYTTTTPTVSGQIKISLPTNRFNSNTMVRFTVRVYEYSTGKSSTYEIGGYNNSGSGGQWVNVFAIQTSDANKPAAVVSYGDDGARNVIWINAGASHSYPQVHVTDVQIGYAGFNDNWGAGWNVDFDTGVPTNVTQTRTCSFTKTSANASNWTFPDYASIYYDTNNTVYYTDPASMSNMFEIRANGRIEYNEWIRYRGTNLQGLIWEGGGGNGWRIVPANGSDMNFRTSGGNGGIRGTIGDDTARGFVHWTTTNDIGFLNPSRAWSLRVDSGGNAFATGTMNGTSFVDANNSARFLDPTSGSSLEGLFRIASSNPTSSSYTAAGLELRESNYSGAGAPAPRLAFHWAGQVASQISIGSNARIEIRNNPGTSFEALQASALYSEISYDSNNSGYYTDPASVTRLNGVLANYYETPYSGGDSGIVRSSRPYGFGFQEGGAWSSPFPDMVFQFHTGMKFAANSSYEGMRFYRDYNDDTLVFQVNGAGNYIHKFTWMKTDTSGFYSDTNGWHIEPNTATSYGSMNVRGTRGGWTGISFSATDNKSHLMFDTTGNGGIYLETGGRWPIYYNYSNNCLGVAGSATSSTYELYVSGDIFAVGSIVAFSDRRKKENIKTIDNALETVLQLRGVRYNKIQTGSGKNFENKTEIGLIAQEVNEVLPEVVSYAADVDEYGVNYQNIVGLLIEGIKDQNKLINSQQEQIDELKVMVAKLMEKM